MILWEGFCATTYNGDVILRSPIAPDQKASALQGVALRANVDPCSGQASWEPLRGAGGHGEQLSVNPMP